MEEDKIEIPEDFEINLDETEDKEETEDETEEELDSIEDIVADTPTSPPPNINFSSDFAPQQFISPQKAASPVLEMNPISQQNNLENELPEVQTTQQETAGQQSQAYEADADYYSNYQTNARTPEIMQPTDPTLQQNFTRMQNQPRLTSTDTGWSTPKNQDWEKKYEVKFKENKRDRRRM